MRDDEFEPGLRAALRREAAPPDFAAKLRRRLPTPAPVAIWRRPLVWAVAAALLLAAAVPPAVSEYSRRREERGREASRQLMIALRITNVKLRQAREKIRHPEKHIL